MDWPHGARPIVFVLFRSVIWSDRGAMSVGEAKARLRQGVTSAGAARKIIEGIVPETADTIQLARHTVHDSRHLEVTKGLETLKAAVDELELVLRRLDASVKAADEYRETLG
ncbi:hypothetical protein [Plantactinospora sp. BB1]|uniref:hypothetical protein n=1 Tax=Plantactinospora sp. BB1 TaxID=2071627 RepID=UPI00131F2547|nr:hypothetical protein [Plantactinospora sp. BB1]